ncbi:MAG: hypothetical protein JRJ87_13050 [Deltaproteobacteria bacterium]|nr:hypothetical protein [Deltaproteobacteria bacterium]
MKYSRTVSAIVAIFVVCGLTQNAFAKKRKSKKPPAPLNEKIKFEAYEGTDIAQIIYLTSRQEFRVGHSPYEIARFHVAEFVLIAEHTRKYLRPDLKAEIKLAPGRTKPDLMASKSFQSKFKSQLDSYRKLADKFKKVKHPKICKTAAATYQSAMQDEIFLAGAIVKRMFTSQQIRARELLRKDLKKRFRSRDKDWFDRLCDEFENEPNLSTFYPRFVDLLIEPKLKKAKEQAEKAMADVGLEYAEAVEEKEDGIID